MRYILIAMLLAGCNMTTDANGSKVISTSSDTSELATVDQCMRAQLFQQCMKSLPAGPIATHYNDWDEVVDECQKASKYMSVRKRKNIKEECRYD